MIYTTADIKQAGYTLAPLVCVHCGWLGEVVYNQYIGDGLCEICGKWQEERAHDD